MTEVAFSSRSQGISDADERATALHHHDVSLAREVGEAGAALVAGEVEHQALLAGVEEGEGLGPAGARGGVSDTIGQAAGRLDADHLGAEIGEEPRGVASQIMRHVEDADARVWAELFRHAAAPLARNAGSGRREFHAPI
jgi:hypothetical protein